jgi:hypothetical protein
VEKALTHQEDDLIVVPDDQGLLALLQPVAMHLISVSARSPRAAQRHLMRMRMAEPTRGLLALVFGSCEF